MPYIQIWQDAPKNNGLPVHEELPKGVEERTFTLAAIREARGYVDDEFKTFHFCHHCDGWIEGDAYESSENTLAPHVLAGRMGTAYYCRRCGKEIGFFGAVS